MKKSATKFVAACAGLILFPATAIAFDGSKNLICSSITTLGCEADVECVRGNADAINLPQFFLLDFKEGIIKSQRVSGEKLSSKIVNKATDKDGLFLQGVDRGVGWSMRITKADGKMVVTASGDDAAFAVFGACMVSP